MRTHMYAHTCIYIYDAHDTYIQMHIHNRIIHIHMHICIRMHTHIPMRIHINTNTRVHAYTHNAYTHIQSHIHTPTRKARAVCKWRRICCIRSTIYRGHGGWTQSFIRRTFSTPPPNGCSFRVYFVSPSFVSEEAKQDTVLSQNY